MLSMLEKDQLLPWLIKEYKCRVGVEVGVREGSNARNLLQQTDMLLIGVDIVKYHSTEELVRQYMPRFSMIYNYSVNAAQMFEKESLDWIYLDADHNYPGISSDLQAWWDKLAIGGVFCGDDYCNCWNPAEGQYEVVRAVEEFIADKNIQIGISGIGFAPPDQRLAYANKIGKLHEDNFTGRNRTENVPVPQWWFIKGK